MRRSYGLRKHIKYFHVSITIHLLYHCPELKEALATFIMHITVLVLYVRDYLPFHWKITRNQPHNTFIPWLAKINRKNVSLLRGQLDYLLQRSFSCCSSSTMLYIGLDTHS